MNEDLQQLNQLMLELLKSTHDAIIKACEALSERDLRRLKSSSTTMTQSIILS